MIDAILTGVYSVGMFLAVLAVVGGGLYLVIRSLLDRHADRSRG